MIDDTVTEQEKQELDDATVHPGSVLDGPQPPGRGIQFADMVAGAIGRAVNARYRRLFD
jgi:hypothetical protein